MARRSRCIVVIGTDETIRYDGMMTVRMTQLSSGVPRPATRHTALRNDCPRGRRCADRSDHSSGIGVRPLWLSADHIAAQRFRMGRWHGPRATHLAPGGAEGTEETEAT